MKRLLIFISMLVLVVGLITGISYGADEERFIFSDLTVKDKKAGLMWTREANIAGKQMTWDNAFKFIEKLNKEKYAGYTDWRLPSKDEFITLIDYAKGKGYKKDFDQVLNKVGFRNVQARYYWSSSTSADDTADAWGVGMWYGFALGYNKTFTDCVWPVRAGQ
jgi:hypothetical protein